MNRLALEVKRNTLEQKILRIFQEDLQNLTEDVQQILADDLVTAFINRIAVFTELQSKASVSALESVV